MKSSKLNSLNRLLTFLLIAALLVCTVGFAAGGLQPDSNEPDSGENGSETDKTDENKDGSTDINPPDSSIDKDNNDNSDTENNKENNNDETTQPPIEIPEKFYNTATGLEVSEEISKRAPIGFVINPNLPLYGISNADISNPSSLTAEIATSICAPYGITPWNMQENVSSIDAVFLLEIP